MIFILGAHSRFSYPLTESKPNYFKIIESCDENKLLVEFTLIYVANPYL